MIKVNEIEWVNCLLTRKEVITISKESIITHSPRPREDNNSQPTRHIQIMCIINQMNILNSFSRRFERFLMYTTEKYKLGWKYTEKF